MDCFASLAMTGMESHHNCHHPEIAEIAASTGFRRLRDEIPADLGCLPAHFAALQRGECCHANKSIARGIWYT